MNKTQHKILIITSWLIISFAFLGRSSQASSLHPPIQNADFVERYGAIACYAELNTMVPMDSIEGVNDLSKRNFDKAKIEIQESFKRHPDSLPLFVAYSQAFPEIWEQKIQAFQKIPRSKLSDDEKFKYATLLLYYWGAFQNHNQADFDLSASLLAELWKKSHSDIVGYMLLNETFRLDQLQNPNLKGLNELNVLETLIRKYSGEKAYRDYKKATVDRFKDDPPSADLVPEQNRKGLNTVVKFYYGLFRRRWGDVIDDRVHHRLIPQPPKPYTPFQLTAQKYFKTWSKNLLASQSSAQ